MRDPYDVLGVSKTAGEAEIKSAYRKLAKKLHPDANKQDPKAASRFAELNAAYEILGEDDKRKAFDRGEIDAEGKPRFRGFEGFGARPGGGPHESQFESFTWGPGGFSRERHSSGGPGVGGGAFEDVLRSMFGGARGGPGGGFRDQFQTEDFGPPPSGQDVSAAVTISLDEAAKGGTRRVQLPSGKEIDVKIPAGLSNGQQIRLKGQGMPGPGGAGDLLITVSVAPHPNFMVDGGDLRLELPVTLYEAVLGGKVRVPTLDGAVDLSIPAQTNSGRTFRLKGKGLKRKSGNGDLLVTVRIMLPDESDDALTELMRKWRDSRPYDPRKDIK
ncbi:MAG: DnaJ C-terminal domain-containing protein [Pseudolabrys sp.]